MSKPVTKTTVSAHLHGMAVEVEAWEVHGVWAVTPHVRDDGTVTDLFWTVTHVPTGMAATRRYGLADREVIADLARRLHEALSGPDWERTDWRDIAADPDAKAAHGEVFEAWLDAHDMEWPS